ncbi:MAG TPA: sensor histidine kinase [Nitrososphaeraceae archaeon]|nr:sensor histidine kinase [Nitrososphaeraceae archaeon]
MFKNVGITRISLLIAALAIVAIIIITAFTEIQSRIISANIIEKKVSEVNVLASRTSLRLTDAATILVIASNLPQITSTPNVSLVSEDSHGVPKNEEMGRRLIARNIMQSYPNFETVSFLLPNGDLYFLEPYESQKNLTLKNFAFRDYYKGVITTGKPYLSQAIRSNATGHIVSAIAAPVHGAMNGSLSGIWIGALNLKDISKVLHDQVPSTEIVAYIDQRGQKIVSSDEREFSALFNGNESLKSNLGFMNGIAGKSGYSIETINGIEMFVAYSPMHALSTNWVVLSFEPYDKVFLSSNSLRLEGIAMSIVLALAATFIALLLHKSFRSLNSLTTKLHKSNEELISKENELKTAKQSLEEKNKELEEANEQLLQRERTQKDFINVAAHELRTPIVPILNLAELLHSKLKKQNAGLIGIEDGRKNERGKIEEIVQVIVRNAYRLYQLTEDILDVTKIETQSLKLRIEQLDLNQIVSSAVSDFRKNNETRNNVEIKFENLANGVTIRGDKGRLVQVITNLLGNALKFTKEGQITVTLTRDNNNEVVVIVKDSGTGIDPEIYPRLFSKFATKSEEGTGLGLYISKKIVEAHGGKIWAQNNPDGKGTTFYFTLPIQSPESLR